MHKGEIQSGEGDVNTIGEVPCAALCEKREKTKRKAIIIRIDSPGGNEHQINLEEVELTKEVKPVVVSMGNYAASGGYYIACNDKIFTENNTIFPVPY
jgi:protease-4